MKQMFSKTISLLFLLLIIFSDRAYAQLTINANTYRFSAANSAATAITATQLIGPGSDNVASSVTEIGFTFWFAGTPYTQFSVNENGLMTLGSTPISGSVSSNLMESASPNPKIAPYWDDLATGTTGSVGYQLTGTAPNRVLRINWNVTIPKNIAGAANATFQVQLYENGDIFFATAAATFPANNNFYSMGIGTSSADFASVTVNTTQTASTCSYGTANNSQTISIGSGKRYQFSVDKTAPTIMSLTTPVTTGDNRTLTATIADQAGLPVSGIPLNGSFVPRVYYKKGIAGTYVSTPGVLTSGNGTTGTWTFTIDHSLFGGAAEGDQIYYYLVAQDQADYKGSPNVSSSPAGVVAADVNTITTPPSGPLYYTIPVLFSGVKTVGNGGDFESLTLPGGLFEQISSGQLIGNLTVNIISDLSETGAKALNTWVNGPGGPFTITINPIGHRIISGATFNGGTANILSLIGVSGLTIDGLNDGSNSLTIVQTGQYLVGAVIDLKGSSNNTITRTTIKGYGASNYAVSITNAVAPSSNNTISFCNITTSFLIPNTWNAGNGIGLLASTSTGDQNVIDNNTITNFVYNGIIVSGKFSNTVISNNNIYNSVGTAWNNNFRGLHIGPAVVGTTNIFNNKIHDLLVQTNASSAGIPAILTSGSAGTTSNIYNNVIYLDASFTHPMQTWYGIQTTGAGTVNIYYNSIYIGGTNITAVTIYGSYGIRKDGTGITNILNNAIFNARSNSTGTGKHYGIYAGTGPFTSNNNNIFVNGIGGIFGNSSAVDRLTLTDWQTATLQDLASYSGNPGFISTTDLSPDVTNPASNTLDGHGVPIASIAVDILGNPRSASLPTPTDIGAYEFVGVPVLYTISGNSGMPGVTLSWTDVTAKTTVSDGSGNYSFLVSNNWSGTITPSTTGYTFTPASRTYTNVVSDQTDQDYTPAAIVYTITGNAGSPGITLNYDDSGAKSVTSDAGGLYSLKVSYNWSGTVTPSLTGFTFTPTNRTYTNVLADQVNQDYTASAIVYTISGNAGVPGVTLSYDDGGAKTVTSDEGGLYSLTVSYNWSGIVIPSLTGYTFTPENRSYTNILADQTSQDYTASPVVYTISGNAGVPGVILSYYDGSPKTVTAGVNGDYSLTVSYDWTGMITPSLEGYNFTPLAIKYSNLLSDQSNQDYTAEAIVYTISGNAGIPGVTLNYEDGVAKTVNSDANGLYSLTVSYNWSGIVFPILEGYNFMPSSISYSNVLSDQTNQDYIASVAVYTISGTTGLPGTVLSYNDGGEKTVIAGTNGDYSFVVSYNWTGTVTPLLTGYSFTPSCISYTNVMSDLTLQNYTATVMEFTISGNAGAARITLSYDDGGAKTVTSGADGLYSLIVSYNWSGTVTPSLTGFTFTPVNISYTNVLTDQTNQDYTPLEVVYTISGTTGLPETVLSYNDGGDKSVTAGTNGDYSFTVSYNWTGTVTPVLAGYSFTPSSISYTNVVSDQTLQNYSATAVAFTISGNAGAAGVTLSYNDNGLKTVTSDVDGIYSLTVSYNWSGTVTPSLAGFTFTPANINYTNVLTDQVNQDYSAAEIFYTISGNAGSPGVTLSYDDGGAKTVTSDADGLYSLTVSYNWSGTVTPSLAGFAFTPANISYTNTLADQINQDYTPLALVYTISGTTGLPGTVLSYNDGGEKTVTAGTNGDYSFTVSYNWTGTVTPLLTGYSFTPSSISYTNVQSDQTLQNYTATTVVYTISGNVGVPGALLSWTDGTAKNINANGSGHYSFTVSFNWSGTVTPSLTGYNFTPLSKTYNNVLSDQTQQDYTAVMTTFTISGNTRVPGTVISWSDGIKNTTTADEGGNYSITVSYGWSGTVTPTFSGYTFSPANHTYTNTLTDQLNQNFTAVPINSTISGNTGVAGVTLRWIDGTNKTVTSDINGNYSLTVSYNWTGTIIPSLAGYTFNPTSRTYKKIITNQSAQNYSAIPVVYTISGKTGVGRVVLSWTDGTAKSVTANGSGNYSFTVSYNWTGTVTPLLSGYTFSPASRSYSNVQHNFTSQNYTATRLAKVSFNSLVTYNNVEISGISEAVENLVVEVERKTDNSDWKNIGILKPEFNNNAQINYKFIDKKVPNNIYYYRIKEIYNEGDFVYSKEIEVEVNAIPLVFKLEQNYPNPFNPSTTILYELPADSKVIIQIFNIIGEQVEELVNGFQTAGFYSQKWYAGNMPSGIYLLRIDARKIGSEETFAKTLKLVLMR